MYKGLGNIRTKFCSHIGVNDNPKCKAKVNQTLILLSVQQICCTIWMGKNGFLIPRHFLPLDSRLSQGSWYCVSKKEHVPDSECTGHISWPFHRQVRLAFFHTNLNVIIRNHLQHVQTLQRAPCEDISGLLSCGILDDFRTERVLVDALRAKIQKFGFSQT